MEDNNNQLILTGTETMTATTVKSMTDEELVSMAVGIIASTREDIRSRWDYVGDYPKASELRQLVSTSEGLFDYVLKIILRYSPESAATIN